MHSRRTTVSAEPEDLAILEGEARRRGLTLSAVLREAVSREADRARAAVKPRFAIVRGDGKATAEVAADESAPARRDTRP